MSKMSNIAMELDERAVELGFADHLEAMANGYDWGVGEDGVAFLWKAEDEQEKAHEAWLKERGEILEEQEQLHDHLMELGYDALAESVYRAIKFIKEQCHD